VFRPPGGITNPKIRGVLQQLDISPLCHLPIGKKITIRFRVDVLQIVFDHEVVKIADEINKRSAIDIPCVEFL